jgi:hypothetical protein
MTDGPPRPAAARQIGIMAARFFEIPAEAVEQAAKLRGEA